MDAHAIAPRFEYGFGLSYTTFTYSGLTIKASGTSQVISFTVKNTGAVTGTEIPQLYLGYPPSAGEPPKVLRGFDEVPLTAGASQQVVMTVGQRDMRYVFFRLAFGRRWIDWSCSIWDTPSQSWVRPPGTFTVFVGASSRDIRLNGSF
jgi:beta-glucosidase